MEVLFIVLNDVSYLDSILKKFVELKVRGATIVDSAGMAKAMMESEGMNLLTSGPFQFSFGDDLGTSKTIFTVIPEVEKVQEVVDAVRSIVDKSKRPVIGFMFTMPVSGIYPMRSKQI